MKQLTVRCPDDLAEKIAKRADLRGESINEYLVGLARDDLAYPTVERWIEDVEAMPPIDWTGHSADLIRADRESR